MGTIVYDASNVAVYKDNMQSYSTTEPAIDLTSTSFLMWSGEWLENLISDAQYSNFAA